MSEPYIPSQWRALGTCDHVNTCQCCGKADLKRTIAIEHESGGISYYGVNCAARALLGSNSLTARSRIERAVLDADRQRQRDEEHLAIMIEQRVKRIANSKSEANQRYNISGRQLRGSYFATHTDGRIVRVDGTDPDDVEFYSVSGFVQSSAPIAHDL